MIPNARYCKKSILKINFFVELHLELRKFAGKRIFKNLYLNSLSYSLLAWVDKNTLHMSDVPSFPRSPFAPSFPGGPGSPFAPSLPFSPGLPTHTQRNIVMVTGFVYKPKDYLLVVFCIMGQSLISGRLKSMIKAKVNSWSRALDKFGHCSSAKSRLCDVAYCGFQCFILQLIYLL